jgi:hypothetical protein
MEIQGKSGNKVFRTKFPKYWKTNERKAGLNTEWS